MNIFKPAAEFSSPRLGKQSLVSLLTLALLFAAWPQKLSASQDAQAPRTSQDARARVNAEPEPPYVQHNPEQMQQLVAPIAVSPD